MILRDSKGKVCGIRVVCNGTSYDIDKRLLYMEGYRKAMPNNALAMAAGEAVTDPEAREFLHQVLPGLTSVLR